MKISVQTGGIEEHLGIEKAYQLIKESGFDAADANVDHVVTCGQINRRELPREFFGSEKDILPLFEPWRTASRKMSVPNYQAHAPFPSYVWCPDDPAYNDALLEMLRKTIIGCDYIDCRNLIIHPFYFPYEHQLPREQENELNLERYGKLADTAKKYGVTINLENMFVGYRGKMRMAVCSDMNQTCQLIDELNRRAGSKVFGFCLDTGHALLLGLDILHIMTVLGDRITAFHVHDNNGITDQHLAPYSGLLDWDRFIEGLKAIHFSETMSFETFNVWNTMDEALCPEYMKFIAKIGRYFAERAEKNDPLT